MSWFRAGWFREGWFRTGAAPPPPIGAMGWFRAGWFRSGWFRTGAAPPPPIVAPPPARTVRARHSTAWPRRRLRWPAKRPHETLGYAIDWSDLLQPGDSVAAVSFVVPSELTGLAAGRLGALGVVVLAGGTAGQRQAVLCRATTAAGHVLERAVLIDVLDL